MIIRYIALFCALVCTALPANAAVTVQEIVLQKGLFAKGDCVPDPSDPSYDECQCDADVRYPEISGLTGNGGVATLNAGFKTAAEEVQCAGKSIDAPKTTDKEKKSPSSVSHHYEVTFQSPNIIGFKFTDWEYTGGAHGNGSVDGVIVDIGKGKILTPGDIFAAKDMVQVNQVIYDTLSAKPEGEVFRDQIESRKGAFIDANGCQGCTLTLSPDGIKVLFQTYEVASFAEGNMEVPIPAQYITYPTITQALAASPKPVSTPAEKK